VRESSQEAASDSLREEDLKGAGDNGTSGAPASGAPASGVAASGVTATAEDLQAMRQALAAAEETARTQRDLYLRAAAELDNVRKRAQRDIENAHRYAIEGLAAELLSVRDGLALGVSNGASADARTLLEGQEATLKMLDRTFEKFSVKQLDPAGQRFDPSLHEAVLMQESNATPNTVLQVVQPGYELKGRLLRPARVIVAKGADGQAG
jgi:molecular chaperone GrpE